MQNIKRGARFSGCGNYRYWLHRSWEFAEPPRIRRTAICIGLNPSTANSDTDDPTIESLMRVLSWNNYSELYMINLFALISSQPGVLREWPRQIEMIERSEGAITEIVDLVAFYDLTYDVVFCWGAFPAAKHRGGHMIKRFPNALCFGKNADGSPRHPLYLPKITFLIKY